MAGLFFCWGLRREKRNEIEEGAGERKREGEALASPAKLERLSQRLELGFRTSLQLGERQESTNHVPQVRRRLIVPRFRPHHSADRVVDLSCDGEPIDGGEIG